MADEPAGPTGPPQPPPRPPIAPSPPAVPAPATQPLPAQPPAVLPAVLPAVPPPSPSLAGLAAGALGAVAMFVGTLLTWQSAGLSLPPGVRAPVLRRLGAIRTTESGIKLADGRVVLGVAVALLLLDIVVWAAQPESRRLWIAAVGALVAPTLPGLGGVGAASPRISRFLQNAITVSKGPGLWLTLAGAVIALAGGAWDLLRPASYRPPVSVEPQKPPAP